MSAAKQIHDELVAKGVMDPNEVPFDESENQAPEIEDEEITLPQVFKLDDPFEFGKGTMIKEVTVSKVPSAASTLHLPIGLGLKLGHYVPILADATGQPEILIKKMSARDYRALVELVSPFLVRKSD